MPTKLPNRIFFTGVPGSKWSGIAQILEQLNGINTTDHNNQRIYSHNNFTGHKGAYFGPGMEFEPNLDADYIDSAWSLEGGCKIVKSHEWSLMLDQVHETFPMDWIMLVHRQHKPSLEWWLGAGGYNITYPNYTAYKDMPAVIKEQNQAIMRWVFLKSCKLERFTPYWVEREFGQTIDFDFDSWHDVFVTLWKP